MAFDIEKLLNDCGIIHKKTEDVFEGRKCTKYKLKSCIFNETHTDNDACFIRYESGAIIYTCFHNSCGNKDWNAAREKIKEKYNLNMSEYWSNDLSRSAARSTRSEITYITGAEIIDLPIEIEWIVEGMLSMGESVLIHAKGGLGKSMFALYLALILASADDTPEDSISNFLCDEFTIPKQRCTLIIGAENGVAANKYRLKIMCKGSVELTRGSEKIIFLYKYNDTRITGEAFSDESFCDFLVNHIRMIENEQDVKIDILIIDPLISYTGAKNENDSAEMRPALDAIDRVCIQAKCTPIVIHHDRKNGDEYRGSTAINDWARNRIGLKKEILAENRITEMDAQEKVTGTRTVKIPAIRVTHEKCNNFRAFSSFLMKMTDNLHFEMISEQISPKDLEIVTQVEQALKGMGGYAESTNVLASKYSELAGVGRTTAKKHISVAVNNGTIDRKSSEKEKNHGYEYFLFKE